MKKRTLNKILTIALTGALTLSAVGCGSKAATGNNSSSEGTIKIGIIQPRSGALAVSGEDSYAAQMIAIDQFNELGGVNGKKIQAVVGDTPDTDAAKTEVTRLVQKEGCKVVTGVYGSAFAEQAAAITNRNHVLYVEAISITNRLTTQGYDNVFRLHFSAASYGTEVAKIASDLSKKYNYKQPKIAIVSMNNDFGLGIAGACKVFAKDNNMNIIADIQYSPDTQDATDIVLKLKNAQPDIVIATSYINDAILITKKCKELNFAPGIWLGVGSGYGMSAYKEALGKDTEGIIDIDPTNYVNPDKIDPSLKDLVSDFQKRFKAKQGYDSPTIGYLEWQTMWFLLNDVIKPCGGTDDVDKLIETAKAVQHNIGYYPTGAGVEFNKNGQNQKAVLSAMQWQDGKLIPIYPDFLAAGEAKNLPLKSWKER